MKKSVATGKYLRHIVNRVIDLIGFALPKMYKLLVFPYVVR